MIEQFLKVCVKVNLVSGRKEQYQGVYAEGKGEPSETTEAGNGELGRDRERNTDCKFSYSLVYLP